MVYLDCTTHKGYTMELMALLQMVAYMIVTGDFPGFNATGVFEEDSPIVDAALTLHALLFG